MQHHSRDRSSMGDWVKSLHNPHKGAGCTIQADSITPGHARFDPRTQNQMPPSAGPGDPCMAPQSAPRDARSNAQQRRFRPQAPDRSRSQESTRNRIQKQQMITPHFLGGVAPVAPSPRGWESACRVRRAPKPNCFGLGCCGSGIPLLRPIGSSEPLLCRAEGVIGAPVCSVRSGGPGPAIARTRGGLLGRWAAARSCCGGTRVDTNECDYTMAHAAQ